MKSAVIHEINRVVDWVNQVAIKTQAFLSFYVLHTFSNQARNPGDPDTPELRPSVFTDSCIYGFIQLIVGRPITNNGNAMPTDRVAVFEHYRSLFEDASTCFIPNIPSYSGCLAHLAKTMAVSNLNSIVETFEGRAKRYLAFRMRQQVGCEVRTQHGNKINDDFLLFKKKDWPIVTVMKDICSHMYSSLAQAEAHALPENLSNTVQHAVDHILADGDILGPAPVTFETLKGNPEVYAQRLWYFLDEMETSLLLPEEDQVVDKCNKYWQIGKDIYLLYTHVYTLTLLKSRTTSFITTFDTRRMKSRMSLII
jgi:hypothetical protein